VRKVNVRVIAATHRDLRLMMSQGKFREDLYFRLAFKTVELPALRERGADIVLLARRFLSGL
jgi:sigma-54-dependent transcriptional regulator